jgi:hypothetical protein
MASIRSHDQTSGRPAPLLHIFQHLERHPRPGHRIPHANMKDILSLSWCALASSGAVESVSIDTSPPGVLSGDAVKGVYGDVLRM